MDAETFQAFTTYLQSISKSNISNGTLPMQQYHLNPYAPIMNSNLTNQQLLCLGLQKNQATATPINPVYPQIMNQSGLVEFRQPTSFFHTNPAISFPVSMPTPQFLSSFPIRPEIHENAQLLQNRESISPQSDDGMNRKRRHDKTLLANSPSKSSSLVKTKPKSRDRSLTCPDISKLVNETPQLSVKKKPQLQVKSLKQELAVVPDSDSPLRHHPIYVSHFLILVV